MRTGLDLLTPDMLPGRNIGLLSHYAAVDSTYRSALDVLMEMPGAEVRAVFGPQHGFHGETQDNMIEWEGYRHPEHGVPVHSLYGAVRKPGISALEGLDCLLVDLQDVGARYYTYVYTMALCMRSCAEAGVPVMVLDRPNPLGLEIIEGRPLERGFESFVGMYPIPVRHGLSIGELALLFARMESLEKPAVCAMEEPVTDSLPPDYSWVHPSPNMPAPETAAVYPGTCLLEATNISEGRGTTRPFSIFGAPWIDGYGTCRKLNGSLWAEGAALRPHAFVPTFGKHSGNLCGGCEIHVTDRETFRPFRLGMGILLELFEYPQTRWKAPPYEYEYEKMPIDILAGGTAVREAVEGRDGKALLDLSRGDAEAHRRLAAGVLLYEREFRS